MKQFSRLGALLFFVIFSPPSFAGRVSRDVINNYYEIFLEGGDRGSVYMLEDGTINMEPSITNKDYIHICSGLFQFDEEYQILKIRKMKNCQFFNGTYSVERINHTLYLRSGQKNLILKPMDTTRD